MGLLTTDFKYDSIQTEFQVSGSIDLKKLNKSLADMQAGLATHFAADHIQLSEVTFSRASDLRYVGQGYALRVPLPDGEITEKTLPRCGGRSTQRMPPNMAARWRRAPSRS